MRSIGQLVGWCPLTDQKSVNRDDESKKIGQQMCRVGHDSQRVRDVAADDLSDHENQANKRRTDKFPDDLRIVSFDFCLQFLDIRYLVFLFLNWILLMNCSTSLFLLNSIMGMGFCFVIMGCTGKFHIHILICSTMFHVVFHSN